jgi:hypothetical protein
MGEIPETSAIVESEVIAPWLAPETMDLVWFAGADAEKFLDDLISQEIEGMTDGETRRSLLLQPRGKVDFILWVIRSGDRIGLATEAGRGDDLAAALSRFRIRVDVSIEPETAERWLVMGGPGRYETESAAGFDVSWPTMRRSLLIGERPDLPTGTLAEYEEARIVAGEPRWDVDIDADSMPHETGLVPGSVDFDKGCFLGQELVARVQSRGANPPRLLRILDFDGEVRAGLPLTDIAGKGVGVLTSVADGLGLALIHRDVTPGDRVLAGETAATVRELPSNSRT